MTDVADEPTADETRWRGRGSRALDLALMATAIVILLSWLALALAHVGDRYGIGWVQGSWMALARYTNAGILYPPLFDGHAHGGTRFMPLPFILHAGAARVTGEYLMSGKVVGYLCFALLLGVTLVALKKLKCSTPLALALVASIIVTNAGLLSATRIQGDALPVALQLAAVTVIVSFPDRRAAVVAAALSVLGVLSKTSAVWAPVAITIWMLARDRRRLLPYLASFAIVLGVLVTVLHVISGGRMLASLLGLTFAGVGDVSSLRDSPYNLLWQFATFAAAAWALVPLALLGAVANVGRREAEIFYISLACEIGIMLVVVADRGVTQNHLIDLVVLTMVATAGVWVPAQEVDRGRPPLATMAIAVIVVWVAATSYALTIYPDARHAVKLLVTRQTDSTLAADAFARRIASRASVLSEDPSVPVSLGQLPVVLDAWMLRVLSRGHPEWTDSLAQRIERKEFNVVVLARALEGNEAWYRGVHFGRRVSEAIARNYRFSEHVGDYYLYVPAAAP
ncbi:MAG TPA: hypothetical protein VFT29_00430 [Gemmatimonadaceae bacterium]|nr:hypothetical protein [Gemmatimonadaceae bacterium]